MFIISIVDLIRFILSKDFEAGHFKKFENSLFFRANRRVRGLRNMLF